MKICYKSHGPQAILIVSNQNCFNQKGNENELLKEKSLRNYKLV